MSNGEAGAREWISVRSSYRSVMNVGAGPWTLWQQDVNPSSAPSSALYEPVVGAGFAPALAKGPYSKLPG